MGMQKPLDGAALIAAERRRQINVEQFDAIHDSTHNRGELLNAAICYAMDDKQRAAVNIAAGGEMRSYFEWRWPFDTKWWKPSPADRVKELVKAGALIAAEIDRLQRLEK